MKNFHLILLKGHVENLPDMNQERVKHGCGSYLSDGTMVREVVLELLMIIILRF